jgi:hypothetical protein
MRLLSRAARALSGLMAFIAPAAAYLVEDVQRGLKQSRESACA